jgi:hypothetical protein
VVCEGFAGDISCLAHGSGAHFLEDEQDLLFGTLLERSFDENLGYHHAPLSLNRLQGFWGSASISSLSTVAQAHGAVNPKTLRMESLRRPVM